MTTSHPRPWHGPPEGPVGGGGSPAGGSLMGAARRCPAEWAFEREADAHGTPDGQPPRLPAYPPFRLGIVAHVGLEAMYLGDDWRQAVAWCWDNSGYDPDPVVESALQRYYTDQYVMDTRYLEVLAVETPVHLWLDPEQEDVDYGVVPAPSDAEERWGLYQALRGPWWQAAIIELADRGAPYLWSSRVDLGVKDRTGTVSIMDHKTCHKVTDDQHFGYVYSWQVTGFALWGRVNVENSKVVLNYVPWHGTSKRKDVPMSEVRLRSFAFSAEQNIQRLGRNARRPVDLWERANDAQVCRRVWGDRGRCEHRDRCRIGLEVTL